MHFAYASFESAFGSFQFEHHATRNDPSLDQAFDLFAGNGGNHAFAMQNAGDVGEIDEVLRRDEFGAGGGHVVGVDVVEFAVGAQAEAGSYGQQIFAPQ